MYGQTAADARKKLVTYDLGMGVTSISDYRTKEEKELGKLEQGQVSADMKAVAVTASPACFCLMTAIFSSTGCSEASKAARRAS